MVDVIPVDVEDTKGSNSKSYDKHTSTDDESISCSSCNDLEEGQFKRSDMEIPTNGIQQYDRSNSMEQNSTSSPCRMIPLISTSTLQATSVLPKSVNDETDTIVNMQQQMQDENKEEQALPNKQLTKIPSKRTIMESYRKRQLEAQRRNKERRQEKDKSIIPVDVRKALYQCIVVIILFGLAAAIGFVVTPLLRNNDDQQQQQPPEPPQVYVNNSTTPIVTGSQSNITYDDFSTNVTTTANNIAAITGNNDN